MFRQSKADPVTILKLPAAGGRLEATELVASPVMSSDGVSGWNRKAYAAAHVVADPLANVAPWLDCGIDWDRTIAFREHLWSLGFGVAEAMDTAQRGMGLDWPTSLEPVKKSIDAAGPDRLIACGAGTDHLAPDPGVTLDDVINAYEMQCEAIEAAGGQVILMASRALAAAATEPADYQRVYEHVLGGLARPAILHWLGEMFDLDLSGYWVAIAMISPWRPALTSSHRTPLRSTASRSPCCQQRRRSACAAACLPGCECVLATTSTTPH